MVDCFVFQMTESMSYLHEFESHQDKQQDTIGIEIELPPTMDMVKQKRTATTTRSIKNRQRSNKQHHHHQNEIGNIKEFHLLFKLFFYVNYLDKSKVFCL